MNIELPTEQRIDMALEDVIKLKNQQGDKKGGNNRRRRNSNNSGGGGSTGNRSNNTNNTRGNNTRRNNTRSNANNNNVNANANKPSKAVKAVGAAQAKREANVANRRGIRNNNKATNQEIKKSVKKVATKKAPTANTSGLKISFKPKELNKTTERVVTQQIRAVLSHQNPRNPAGGKGNSNNSSGSNAPKSVLSKGSGNNSKRANPKVRAKTGILRIQR